MRFHTLKSNEEVTALINEVLAPQGWRVVYYAGLGWKALRMVKGEKAPMGHSPCFKTRPELTQWLTHKRHVRGLSSWMRTCYGALLERRR